MGRKGVSKQKPKQTKSKNVGANSTSSVMQASDNQTEKSHDKGFDTTKSTSNWNKNSKKE
jgi:hypothetical protein